MADDVRLQRRTREGVVVSNAMEKTAIVAVSRRGRHSRYRKILERTRRYLVHDENNACQVGDRVSICETRPLSRHKRWRLREVLERSVRQAPGVVKK
ncbi:MAG: 30S ribosomal protein S17 [Candidatus Binatia bacterium]